ncbi:hypothetical protein [Streptomyces sp. NPDC048521]|uniref:hypothetical protein n=1 Tax=Streptomyces sp. NPDC048521 TaxID=3365566 RepID=UPI003712D5C8
MHCNQHGRTALPDPRSRSGAVGHRFPRTGTGPATARTALRLRRLPSAVLLPLFAAATAVFAVLVVVSRRRRRERSEAP